MLFKIFGAMSKKTHIQKSVKFWHRTDIEEVIGFQRDKFLKRYCATDNYLCRLINARHQLNSGSILFYLCAVVFFFACFICIY